MVSNQLQKTTATSLCPEDTHEAANMLLFQEVSSPFNQERTILKAEEDCARRIIDQMPGILWAIDLNFNITFARGNGLARLSPSMCSFVGMPLTEFFNDTSEHSHMLDAHFSALRGYAQSFELRVTDIMFSGTVEPLFDADWKLIGAVGVAAANTGRIQQPKEDAQQPAMLHDDNLPATGAARLPDTPPRSDSRRRLSPHDGERAATVPS